MVKSKNKTQGKGEWVFFLFIIIVLLIYQFPRKDDNDWPKNIANEDVVLVESIQWEFDKMSGYDDFYPVIKNNKLNIKKISSKDLFPNYCTENSLGYRNQIISIDPLIVECFSLASKIKYITNGKWKYDLLKTKQDVIGGNKNFLLLSDYTLINKHKGTYSKGINKARDNYASSTLSLNGRIFVSNSGTRVVSEVKQDGSKIKIVRLPKTILKRPHVNEMVASDDGNFLFLLTENMTRGASDLFLQIIDVKLKTIIFSKALKRNSFFSNTHIQYNKGNILLLYTLQRKLFAYWYKLDSAILES